MRVVITELARPLAVRRLVSFAQAAYDGEIRVEEVPARRVGDAREVMRCLEEHILPVLIDPEMHWMSALKPLVYVDARLRKLPPDTGIEAAPLVIGLGPGFTAGENCHAVVETQRGHHLGRVIWQGAAAPDSGLPDAVGPYRGERVLRAPADGVVVGLVEIGERVQAGDVIATVSGQPVRAVFSGVLRGLIQPGLEVTRGLKIGDLDPRDDPSLSRLVSDKALSVGGGVLEAVLVKPEIRACLWDGAACEPG